jgi:hypothetical protein
VRAPHAGAAITLLFEPLLRAEGDIEDVYNLGVRPAVSIRMPLLTITVLSLPGALLLVEL